MEEKVDVKQHVGITALKVPRDAQDAAEKLGFDLADRLLGRGAKEILTLARQLNDSQ